MKSLPPSLSPPTLSLLFLLSSFWIKEGKEKVCERKQTKERDEKEKERKRETREREFSFTLSFPLVCVVTGAWWCPPPHPHDTHPN